MAPQVDDQGPPLLQPQRPWYYRNWFLFPVFFLGWPVIPYIYIWPVWAVLIVRSPWHTSIVLRALAWAMLIVGAVVLVSVTVGDPVLGIRLLLPGVVLTVVIQKLWSRHRQELMTAGSPEGEALPPDTTAEPREFRPLRPRRTTLRRRGQRRRGPRPGRQSRHPF